MKLFVSFILSLFIYSSPCGAQGIRQALANKDTAAITQLINSGNDISAYDSLSGSDYLMSACRYENNPALVGFLLRKGASVDKNRSPQGRTALHVACAYYGCLNTIQLLVEYGSNVNTPAKDGTTPLMLAAMGAKADVVEYLLKKGADKNAKDIDGKRALDYAQKSRDDEDTKRWIKCPVDKASTIRLLHN